MAYNEMIADVLPTSTTVVQKMEGVGETFNLAILIRGSGTDESEWAQDNRGLPYVDAQLPMYMNLVNFAMADAIKGTDPQKAGELMMTGVNGANAPTTDKQSYVFFQKDVMGESMSGYVEVVSK